MRQTFENIVQQNNELSMLIEDLLNNLPNTPKYYKLKTKVKAAYTSMIRALERHESLITDAVPPVEVATDGYTKEFIQTWLIYKDFMIEQFGVRMGTRMQVYRLELLIEYANKDMALATRWLKYYMANNSANIYPVKEIKLELENEPNDKKAEFTLPAGFKS